MKIRIDSGGKRVRVGVASVVSAILILSLSGCWTLPNQFQGPLAIQLNNGELSVAICEDVVASGVWGEVTATDQTAPFWDAESTSDIGVRLPRGTILDSDNLGSYFPNVTSNSDLNLAPNSDIYVIIQSIDGVEGNLLGAFAPDAQAGRDGMWTHPDDSLTAEPCE